ncbi:hypothetical protein HD597_004458 [Nonomuraea thailandensis]|uniref:Uncharacterized protein n=1 Tax=Nonomuraea thailandensis TaxID=1188745 RepID=A0A9X2GMP1_9ACTN|nr:hypothetical protein [Nonomuraea thailandensis]MCP2357438.1 hypothetical protein [Nonomuraea thailandensis]
MTHTVIGISAQAAREPLRDRHPDPTAPRRPAPAGAPARDALRRLTRTVRH